MTTRPWRLAACSAAALAVFGTAGAQPTPGSGGASGSPPTTSPIWNCKYWVLDNNNQWIVQGGDPNGDGFEIKLDPQTSESFTGHALNPIHSKAADGTDVITAEESGTIEGLIYSGNVIKFTIAWASGGVDQYQGEIDGGRVFGSRTIARHDLWASRIGGWHLANNAHCTEPPRPSRATVEATRKVSDHPMIPPPFRQPH